MDASKRTRGERQPLLREVPPVPIQEEGNTAPDDLCHAHEHDTDHHDTSHTRTSSTVAKILATTTSFLVLGTYRATSTPQRETQKLTTHQAC